MKSNKAKLTLFEKENGTYFACFIMQQVKKFSLICLEK